MSNGHHLFVCLSAVILGTIVAIICNAIAPGLHYYYYTVSAIIAVAVCSTIFANEKIK
jgi:hypothetical protein